MTDPELTVRTIETMLPQISTAQLHKWKAIFTTAVLKIDRELESLHIHTCTICFLQEYGWRNELPVSWFQKGDAEICFQHDYNAVDALLEDAEPFPDKELETVDKTLEELMDLI